MRMLILIALILPTTPILSGQSCSSLQGAWKQSHFIGKEDTKESKMFVITDVSDNCTFTATFDGDGYKHVITGKIGSNEGNGAMKVERTDPNGCKNLLFGTIYIVWSNKGKGLIFGRGDRFVWKITSSEPKCGMGASHPEERQWTRP